MNKCIEIGRLTRDIELRQTTAGTPVCSFTLAVPRRKKEQGTNFIDCVAFGITAEIMERYTHKGSKICVSGYINVREYTDKNGNKRKAVELNADEIEFLDEKRKEEKEEAPVEDESFLDAVSTEDIPF